MFSRVTASLHCRNVLQQMPYMEFYQGLRERNWTSPWYQQEAQPWKVQIFQDSGRFMAPCFPGYRCALTLGEGVGEPARVQGGNP